MLDQILQRFRFRFGLTWNTSRKRRMTFRQVRRDGLTYIQPCAK